MKILIAEGDNGMREDFADSLRRKKHEVTAVWSGEAILETLAKDPSYDVPMTSNSLVGKSGIEVLRELRANDRFRELPIIMYSGDRLGRIEYEAEQLKAVYLDKAFYSMSDAMDKLKEIKL